MGRSGWTKSRLNIGECKLFDKIQIIACLMLVGGLALADEGRNSTAVAILFVGCAIGCVNMLWHLLKDIIAERALVKDDHPAVPTFAEASAIRQDIASPTAALQKAAVATGNVYSPKSNQGRRKQCAADRLVFRRRTDIIQGTDNWRNWRDSVIGSSDAPTLMGENPWKTRDALLEEKLGVRRRFSGNAATRRGVALEPQAREVYERYRQVRMAPAVLENISRQWQIASVDGIDVGGTLIVEIKCGIKSYEHTSKTGRPPQYYYGQLQHILSVTGLESLDYCCYNPGKKTIIFAVERDNSYIDRLLREEERFYGTLMAERLPPKKRRSSQIGI